MAELSKLRLAASCLLLPPRQREEAALLTIQGDTDMYGGMDLTTEGLSVAGAETFCRMCSVDPKL